MARRVKKLYRNSCYGRRAGRGFTIAEVMMAAAIMALAIATSITTMQRAFLALDSARNMTLTSQILQSELERMRLRPWTTVSTYSAGPTEWGATDFPYDDDIVNDAFVTKLRANRGLRLTRTVSTVSGHNGDLRQITFTIYWRGYDARAHSRSISTYYGNGGLYDYYANSF